MMYDFIVYDHTKDIGCVNVTLADSGQMTVTSDGRYMLVTLYNGIRYEDSENRADLAEKRHYPFRQDKFDKQTLVFSLAGFDFDRTDESYFKNSYQVQDITELNKSTDSLENLFSTRTSDVSNALNNRFYLRHAVHRDNALEDSILRTRKLKPSPTQRSKFGMDDMLPSGKNIQDSAYLAEDSILKRKAAFAKDSVRKTLYTLSGEGLKVTVSIDSLYNSLSEADKAKVLKKTKDFAVDAQSLVVRNEEDLTSRRRTIAKYRNEWHQKFTLSFACMIFFFIGAPLGAIIKKGGFGLPIVVSVLVFLAYYMISTAGMKLAREGVWESWQGMWLSSFVVLPLGIFLTYKATVDAQLFNKEAWVAFFKKIGNFFNRKKEQ